MSERVGNLSKRFEACLSCIMSLLLFRSVEGVLPGNEPSADRGKRHVAELAENPEEQAGGDDVRGPSGLLTVDQEQSQAFPGAEELSRNDKQPGKSQPAAQPAPPRPLTPPHPLSP